MACKSSLSVIFALFNNIKRLYSVDARVLAPALKQVILDSDKIFLTAIEELSLVKITPQSYKMVTLDQNPFRPKMKQRLLIPLLI